jgi:hypothetical protein
MLVLIKFHELCCKFYMQVHIWDKTWVTGPHQPGAAQPAGAACPAGATGPAGAADPAGAAGPAPRHNSGPGDYHFHEHALEG